MPALFRVEGSAKKIATIIGRLQTKKETADLLSLARPQACEHPDWPQMQMRQQ